MIHILERLDKGDKVVQQELDYGRFLAKAWPGLIEGKYETPILEMIEKQRIPERMNESYMSTAEDAGFDPRNDELKFTYLYSIAMSLDHLSRAIALFYYCFEHKLEPVVFEDERAFYILIGHLGMGIVYQNDMKDIQTLIQFLTE